MEIMGIYMEIIDETPTHLEVAVSMSNTLRTRDTQGHAKIRMSRQATWRVKLL